MTTTTDTITTDLRSTVRADECEAGFALVVVIWITGLVALMTLSFAASVRQHINATSGAVTTARLAAFADAGVTLAAADLVRAHLRREAPSMLGRVHRCRLPDGEVLEVSVGDEAGKVDLNVAGEEILTALFAGIGHTATAAQALADAVMDFRDSDDAPRAHGAESEEYRASGHAAVPRNAPFESIAELAQVIGVTATDVAKLRRLVTVRSGQEGIDTAVAAPDVVDTLARGAASMSLASAITTGSGDVALPGAFRVSSGLQAIGVRSTVVAPNGATYVREAVIGLARRVASMPTEGLTGEAAAAASARRPRRPSSEAERIPGIKVWEWYRSGSVTEPARLSDVQVQSEC